MGWFSTPKCPVHGIEYSVGKDDMCQPAYYCKKCMQKAYDNRKKELERQEERQDLENRIAELERRLNNSRV